VFYFHFIHNFVEEVLPTMVTKSMDIHVLPRLEIVATIFVSFDLWMFRGSIDTFALVINYLSKSWKLMHVIVGLFEVNETTGSCMACQLQYLLDKFGLIHRVFVFVKDEGRKLASMAITLHSIIDCGLLNLP